MKGAAERPFAGADPSARRTPTLAPRRRSRQDGSAPEASAHGAAFRGAVRQRLQPLNLLRRRAGAEQQLRQPAGLDLSRPAALLQPVQQQPHDEAVRPSPQVVGRRQARGPAGPAAPS